MNENQIEPTVEPELDATTNAIDGIDPNAAQDLAPAWTPAVGDVVLLASSLAGGVVTLMTVENVYEATVPAEYEDGSRKRAVASELDDSAPESVMLAETTWMASDGKLQRATFDWRVIAPIEALVSMIEENATDAPAPSAAPAQPKRRGRPPGVKNKRKRKASKKR